MSAAAKSISPAWLQGKSLLIASHNKGKIAEIRDMIAPFHIGVMSAADAKLDEPEETGTTFTANAELKARHAFAATGMAALADDSGIAIPALNGAPGVYSARWAGPDKDFAGAFSRIQKELAEKNAGANPKAYFVCALSLCMPDGTIHTFEGRFDGTLTFPPRGQKGFGYDPIFIPEGYHITWGEMDAAEKNRMSHRARAFKQFVDFIQHYT